jgi:hypothetical protein
MKKALIILFLFASIAMSDNRQKSFSWIRSQDITNTRHFIWQGDTIDFTNISGNITDVDIDSNGYFRFYSDTVLIDSVYLDYTQSIDTFLISGDSVYLKISGDELKYLDISSLTSKLDTVAHGSNLSGQGTADDPLELDSTIIASIMKSVYSITLPSSTTVAGRCSGAVEGTDYPSGWTIEADSNPVDLKVTHGLNRRVASVTVFSSQGEEQRQLFGNAAYSGVLTQSDTVLVVESLATIQKEIVVYITFE